MKNAFCFDLDGTITSREILPILAEEIGIHDEIQALTDATIKGLIHFDASFKLRCKLLSEIPISRVQDIINSVPLFPKIIEFINNNNSNSYIITGNLDVWTAQLFKNIGVKSFTSSARFVGDKLLGVDSVLNKGLAIDSLRSSHQRLIAIGDGMGDVAMFERADVRISFAGVHAPVQPLLEISDMLCASETALCNVLESLT
jgi:phosphoserine phosphatase